MSSHPTQQQLSPDPVRARAIAWLILEGHRQHGTVKKLAALRRGKRGKRGKGAAAERGRSTSDSAHGAMLMLFAMAVYFGVIEQGCPGLMVYASRRDIADSIGLQFRSTYRPVRDLVDVGAIRVIRPGGNLPDAFELLVPGGPAAPIVTPATPVDSLREAILCGNAFSDSQKDLLLSLLVRIERLEGKKGGI